MAELPQTQKPKGNPLAGFVVLLVIVGGSVLLWNHLGASGNSPNTTDGSASSSTTTNTSDTPQPEPPTCTSYTALDSQTWLEIVKDPGSYKDQCFTVYGEVTQFDSATGTNGFRANVGGVQLTPSYGFVNYPTNTVLVGDPTMLKDVVNQDLFTASVMVLGSYSYDTQIGGHTTVPQLQVDAITVTGTVDN